MTIHDTLMEKFPVRKSKEEKEAFRAWAVEYGKSLGWSGKVEKGGRISNNVVFGDPDGAAVLVTAHYDTPANMIVPNLLIPRNVPLFVLYQVAVVLLLFAVTLIPTALIGLVIPPYLVLLVWSILYFGALALLMVGPANKHNANDNTSGVAAALEAMSRIPEEQRSRVAFVLFDNEEKGLFGSSAFAKAHQQVQFLRLVVNMDCVGYGEHMLLVSTAMARKATGYYALEGALKDLCPEGMEAHPFDSKTCYAPSDQKNFKCGTMLFACKRKKVIGFHTPRLHTGRDTECSWKNIDYVAAVVTEMTNRLGQ